MKKIIYILLVSLSPLFFVACDDYLSVQSPDKLTSGTFWRNLSDAEAGLSAAYSQLEYSIDTWEFAEVKWPVEAYREDVVIMGNDAMNYPNCLARVGPSAQRYAQPLAHDGTITKESVLLIR